MDKRLKRALIVLGVIFLSFLIGAAIQAPRAKEHQTTLVEAFGSIPDVGDARIIKSSSGYKNSHWRTERNIRSELPVSAIRSFYVDEFRRQNWNVECERFSGDRKWVVFARGEDVAVLDLPKVDGQTTGEYSLRMSWGMNCC